MAASEPIVIAVVEDSELIRMGLRTILATYWDGLMLVELDADVIDAEIHGPIHVVLLDPAEAAISDQLVSVLLADPRVEHVIAFSWRFDEVSIEGALRIGLHGYLSKSLRAAELTAALEDVLAGELVIRGPSHPRASPHSWLELGRALGLSTREAQVLTMIVHGRSNDEITRATLLSANTLKSYVRSLYRKIGASTRVQAVRWGLTNGFAAASVHVGAPTSEPEIGLAASQAEWTGERRSKTATVRLRES